MNLMLIPTVERKLDLLFPQKIRMTIDQEVFSNYWKCEGAQAFDQDLL